MVLAGAWALSDRGRWRFHCLAAYGRYLLADLGRAEDFTQVVVDDHRIVAVRAIDEQESRHRKISLGRHLNLAASGRGDGQRTVQAIRPLAGLEDA